MCYAYFIFFSVLLLFSTFSTVSHLPTFVNTFSDEFSGKICRYSAFLFLGRLRAPPPIRVVFYGGLRMGIAL